MVFMQQAPVSKTSPKVSSISRRFSYALIGIITLLLLAFAAVVIYFDINRIEREMQKRLDNAIRFAQNSLPAYQSGFFPAVYAHHHGDGQNGFKRCGRRSRGGR
jgi:hypothetical protein